MTTGHVLAGVPSSANVGRAIRKADRLDTYRRFSMISYGVAAAAGTALMGIMSINAMLAVALPFAIAAVADRFLNRDAEPDERMRSFVVYLIGGVAGLVIYLMFSSRLGSMAFIAPIIGFGVAALCDYFVPPAGYQPRDPHRYGESPPVTVR